MAVTHQSSSLVFTWKRHHFLFPDWQRDYESAFCEADDAELFKKVEVAEAAMLTRRDALPGGVENRAEWQSLEDALADVCALKKKRFEEQKSPTLPHIAAEAREASNTVIHTQQNNRAYAAAASQALPVLVVKEMQRHKKYLYPGALSLGMILPVVNIVLLYFLGFSDWPVLKQLKASRSPL